MATTKAMATVRSRRGDPARRIRLDGKQTERLVRELERKARRIGLPKKNADQDVSLLVGFYTASYAMCREYLCRHGTAMQWLHETKKHRTETEQTTGGLQEFAL